MASSNKPDPESTKAEAAPPTPAPSRVDYFALDVALRVLLFAATVTALVVLAASKQTKNIFVLAPNGLPVPVTRTAKFSHSPALIYLLVALCVTCLYSILTTIASLGVISKPVSATKFLLHFAFWDLLMLGILASGTGTAGGVAYVGLKGNSHVGWIKVCNNFDKFCQHLGSSIAISLFASVLLVFLTMLSIFSLYKRIPKS